MMVLIMLYNLLTLFEVSKIEFLFYVFFTDVLSFIHKYIFIVHFEENERQYLNEQERKMSRNIDTISQIEKEADLVRKDIDERYVFFKK